MSNANPITELKPRKVRRTSEQWQSLIEAFEQSGLGVQAFCAQQNIAYSSFAKWRSRFKQDNHPGTTPRVSFIPLSETASLSNNSPWRIELDLGGGVVLRLTQSRSLSL